MKILYVATIAPTLSFFKSTIKRLIEEGNTVDIAANEAICPPDSNFSELGCRFYQLPWGRNPFSWENADAIDKLKKTIEENNYDIVHCHTPVAAACTRLACRKLRRDGLKVVYTAHGFHFFEGAPVKNWLIYFPIEWICSFWTDVIITINQEDYCRARRLLHSKKVEYVPGVGVDVEKFAYAVCDRTEKRRKLGLHDEDFVILSVGELSQRKNQQIVIQALSGIRQKNCKYLIAGVGPLHDELKKSAEALNLKDRVIMLGFRTDISSIYACADLFILPSLQEGLPVALMEAIASKIPVLCSNIRGNTELVNKAQTFPPKDAETLRKMIGDATEEKKNNAATCVEENFERLKDFSSEIVNEKIIGLYKRLIQ